MAKGGKTWPLSSTEVDEAGLGATVTPFDREPGRVQAVQDIVKRQAQAPGG